MPAATQFFFWRITCFKDEFWGFSFSHSTEVRTFDCVSCCFKHLERRVLLKFSISTRWLSRCARSDWSRIASYLAIIISHGVILAGVLNSKMAVPRFFNVSEEVINAKEESSIWKSTKDVTEFDGTLFKSRMWIFCWLNKINLLKLSVYLDTSDQQNYNKTCEIFSSFTTEFESTWAIMLKQVSPQAQWPLLNTSRDEYSTLSLSLRRITAKYHLNANAIDFFADLASFIFKACGIYFLYGIELLRSPSRQMYLSFTYSPIACTLRITMIKAILLANL